MSVPDYPTWEPAVNGTLTPQLVITCGRAEANGRRLVVAELNGRTHRDLLDTDAHWQREKFRTKAIESLGLTDDAHEFLEEQITKRADAADAEDAGPLNEPLAKPMSAIEAMPVRHLWPHKLYLGRINLLAGRPGDGKSFATMDWAGRITTGTPWPDGSPCERGSVLLINAEDDPSDTLRPRLEAHHADLDRVTLLTGVRRVGDDHDETGRLFCLHDLDVLDSALTSMRDCRMLVLDPIGSFFGAAQDSYRDNEVRSVLAPLARLANQRNVAVVIVAHHRKSAGKFADDAIMGSRAFTGIARAVWHVARDPDNPARRLLLPGKQNNGPEQKGLAFSIGGEPPAVRWERGEVTTTADSILGDSGKGSGTQADKARRIIAEILASGPRGSNEVEQACLGEGISVSTCKRVRKQMGVLAERTAFGGDGQWMLSLPSDLEGQPEDEF